MFLHNNPNEYVELISRTKCVQQHNTSLLLWKNKSRVYQSFVCVNDHRWARTPSHTQRLQNRSILVLDRSSQNIFHSCQDTRIRVQATVWSQFSQRNLIRWSQMLIENERIDKKTWKRSTRYSSSNYIPKRRHQHSRSESLKFISHTALQIQEKKKRKNSRGPCSRGFTSQSNPNQFLSGKIPQNRREQAAYLSRQNPMLSWGNLQSSGWVRDVPRDGHGRARWSEKALERQRASEGEDEDEEEKKASDEAIEEAPEVSVSGTLRNKRVGRRSGEDISGETMGRKGNGAFW